MWWSLSAHPKGPGRAVKFYSPSRSLRITACTFMWGSAGHTAGNSLGGNSATTTLWNSTSLPSAGQDQDSLPLLVRWRESLYCNAEATQDSRCFPVIHLLFKSRDNGYKINVEWCPFKDRNPRGSKQGLGSLSHSH